MASSVVEQQMPLVDEEETFPLFVEFFVVFVLIVVFSTWNRRSLISSHKKKKQEEFRESKQVNSTWCKAIEEKGTAGDLTGVLKIWNSSKDSGLVSQSALPYVVKAAINASPSTFVDDISDQLAKYCQLRQPESVNSIVDIVATASVPPNVELLQDLVGHLESNFGIRATPQMSEAMAGAFAHVGKIDKMEECLAVFRKGERKASARCRCTVLRGLLHCRNADAALISAKEMKALGYSISPYLVTDIYRLFCRSGRAPEVLSFALPEVPPSSHAAVMLLEHTADKKDVELAKKMMQVFDREGTELCPRAHETLMKVLVSCGDAGAFELFEQMKKLNNYSMSEGFCMSLLTKCAESKFLKFAEFVVEHVRRTSIMSVALYSAHMKVYASSDMYEKACDLYEQMRKEGLEPDAAMCSPVAWYAAECGRHDLSKQLAEQSPQFRAHRWMSSIRGCVKDKEVQKACEYLSQALSLGCKDAMIFNCALDVCAAAGHVEKAWDLLALMKIHSKPDLVSFNTVLKCYSTKGDLRGARYMLTEMEKAGFPPNEVSYNVIINMAVTHGSFRQAWDTIEVMSNKGISVDCYTISTLLKAVKKSNSQHDLQKVFSLMDKLKIDVSADEVLMNCVLEMCMRHRLFPRMAAIVNSLSSQSMKPSPHTYGMLFRASAELKDFARCFALWDEMVNVRGIEPNKVTLSAMIDALTSAGKGAAACQLLEQWKAKVLPTMAMYQMLPKGFPQSGRGAALVKELRKAGLTMTTMLYNFLIDGEAKAGEMKELVYLVEMMNQDGCQPDNFTVSLQVKGYCYSGELKKACSVFDKARQQSLKADTVAFNTLLDGCIRHNDFPLADQLIASIETYGVVPSNFTVGTIIKMWGRRRQLDKCFEAADEFCQKYNIVPSGPVRACLMSACVLNKDIDRAFGVLRSIRSGHESLDAKALGSLISLCTRSSRLDDAVKLMDELGMDNSTREIGGEVLDQLAFALGKADQLESVGIPLFKRLKARGVNVGTSGQVTQALLGARH